MTYFLRNTRDKGTSAASQVGTEKTRQAVACVLIACKNEILILTIGSPDLQDVVDVMGGRALNSSKQMLETAQLQLYQAILICFPNTPRAL